VRAALTCCGLCVESGRLGKMRKGLVLSLLSLGAIFGYAVYQRGGVYRADWNWCLLALAVLALCSWWSTRSQQQTPPIGKELGWPLLLMAPYVALQLLPLPEVVLRTISPARAHLVDALSGILPDTRWSPLSVEPAVTLEHLFRVLAYLTVFLLVREVTWRSSSRPWMVVFPIMVVAAFEATLGLVQAFSGQTDAMAKGTYVNRNHFAGLISMVLPFAVMWPASVLRKNSPRLRALSAVRACSGFVLAALLVASVLFSLSRMGFLASLASVLMIALLGFAGAPTRSKWLGAGVVIGLVVLGFLFLSPGQLLERFVSLSSSENLSAEGRLALWRETGHLIAAYPLFGCGLGTYEAALHKYKVTGPLVRYDYAHNDYLQLLAELGVIGFTIAAALLLALVVKAWRVSVSSKDTEKRHITYACVGAFTAIGLYSLVDFNLYIPANAMLLAWIGGIAAGVASSGTSV
jgi:O-antigen ligase